MNPFMDFESRNAGVAGVEGAHYRVSAFSHVDYLLAFPFFSQ
jgi:hypothetical protein